MFYADYQLFQVAHGHKALSEIHFVETHKRQRKPRSAKYRDAWELILQAYIGKKNCLELPVQLVQGNF